MPLIVRAFPVNCSKCDVEALAGEMYARSADMHRFYDAYGVRREAWFHQNDAERAYVIAVTDAGKPVEQMAEEYAAANDGFARWFQQRVLELSGVDQREQPLGPATEQVFDSTGGALRSGAKLVVRMYPLRDGGEPLREFARELAQREEETRAFHDAYELEESWWIQDVGGQPHAIAIAALSGDIEGNARRYAESQEPFVAWFKQRVIDTTGVDPNRTPLGPPSEQVFEFNAT